MQITGRITATLKYCKLLQCQTKLATVLMKILCMSRLLPMQHHQDSHLQKLSRPVQKLLARPFNYYAIGYWFLRSSFDKRTVFLIFGKFVAVLFLRNAHYFLLFFVKMQPTKVSQNTYWDCPSGSGRCTCFGSSPQSLGFDSLYSEY